MNKEERRLAEARRKQTRVKLAKAAIVTSAAVLMPVLFFLVTQR